MDLDSLTLFIRRNIKGNSGSFEYIPRHNFSMQNYHKVLVQISMNMFL